MKLKYWRLPYLFFFFISEFTRNEGRKDLNVFYLGMFHTFGLVKMIYRLLFCFGTYYHEVLHNYVFDKSFNIQQQQPTTISDKRYLYDKKIMLTVNWLKWFIGTHKHNYGFTDALVILECCFLWSTQWCDRHIDLGIKQSQQNYSYWIYQRMSNNIEMFVLFPIINFDWYLPCITLKEWLFDI